MNKRKGKKVKKKLHGTATNWMVNQANQQNKFLKKARARVDLLFIVWAEHWLVDHATLSRIQQQFNLFVRENIPMMHFLISILSKTRNLPRSKKYLPMAKWEIERTFVNRKWNPNIFFPFLIIFHCFLVHNAYCTHFVLFFFMQMLGILAQLFALRHYVSSPIDNRHSIFKELRNHMQITAKHHNLRLNYVFLANAYAYANANERINFD